MDNVIRFESPKTREEFFADEQRVTLPPFALTGTDLGGRLLIEIRWGNSPTKEGMSSSSVLHRYAACMGRGEFSHLHECTYLLSTKEVEIFTSALRNGGREEAASVLDEAMQHATPYAV